jgi:hypothetical protein
MLYFVLSFIYRHADPVTGIQINVSILESNGELKIFTTMTHFCVSTLSDASMKYLNMKLETPVMVDRRASQDDLDMSGSLASERVDSIGFDSKRYSSSIFDRDLPNIVELVKHLYRADSSFSFSGEICTAAVSMHVNFSASLITPVAVAPHMQKEDISPKFLKGILLC